jgi:hypothetical protein
MRSLVDEHNVQGDVVHPVVHRAGEFAAAGSSPKEDDTGVILEIPLTRGDQPVDRRRGGIVEGEVDVVGEHGAGREQGVQGAGSRGTEVKRWNQIDPEFVFSNAATAGKQ